MTVLVPLGQTTTTTGGGMTITLSTDVPRGSVIYVIYARQIEWNWLVVGGDYTSIGYGVTSDTIGNFYYNCAFPESAVAGHPIRVSSWVPTTDFSNDAVADTQAVYTFATANMYAGDEITIPDVNPSGTYPCSNALMAAFTITGPNQVDNPFYSQGFAMNNRFEWAASATAIGLFPLPTTTIGTFYLLTLPSTEPDLENPAIESPDNPTPGVLAGTVNGPASLKLDVWYKDIPDPDAYYGGYWSSTETCQGAGLWTIFGYVTPVTSRQDAWTFVLDGHRFYVLPLGDEGTWAYDTTTKEWCQLQTQEMPGINFRNGCMWDLKIMGGDTVEPILLQMDPNEPLDNETTPVKHMVTGGIPTRSRNSIGVGEVTMTASVQNNGSTGDPISLAFSDDNGVNYSPEMDITLTDSPTQTLIWSSLGSFNAPGRIFRVTDYSGPIRIDGADAILDGDPS